jgi:hypothetical protein
MLNLNNSPLALNWPPYIYGVGDPLFTRPGWGVGSSFACDVFALNSAMNANYNNYTAAAGGFQFGLPNLLQIALDQTTYTHRNYMMGGMAIQPMDVRIEAVIYAQEGSFYVIPGNWFNPNPADREDAPQRRASGINPKFPYFGQPLDIRIIIDGAVSENVPAPIGDQEEWMSKWGRIPDTYGSSTVRTAHPGEGFTILYDDHVAWPLKDMNGTEPIRYDAYGRALPIAPRLPVCGTLLYSGDVM